jgi:hypothetical protein
MDGNGSPEIKAALEKLVREIPVELLKKGPERYASLEEDMEGSWRFVFENGLPVALVWTDWEDGFDKLSIQDGPTNRRLEDYIVNAKALDIDAGMAYTTLETFVNRFDEKVELGESETGKLSGAVKAAQGNRGEASRDGS